METLHIKMFGGFNIYVGEQILTNTPIRSNKVWRLLKFLFANRKKAVPCERLIDFLWNEETCADPMKSLRDIVYRARKMLAQYGNGHTYILFMEDSYQWNPAAPCSSDVDEFEDLLKKARDKEPNTEERIRYYTEAVELYKGTFLGGGIDEQWAAGYVSYYRRLFLQAVEELLNIYEEDLDLEAVILLTEKALESEPSEEILYIRQVRAMITNGEYATAIRQCRRIENILDKEYGAKLSEELLLLYEEAKTLAAKKNSHNSFNDIKKILDSMEQKKGAVSCSFNTFREIYKLDKRAEERFQFPIYLALITLSPPPGDTEGQAMLSSGMKALRKVLIRCLRRGDVISQYSQNQFVLMLTAENTLNGLAALERIRYLFYSHFGEHRLEFSSQLAPTYDESNKERPEFDAAQRQIYKI